MDISCTLSELLLIFRDHTRMKAQKNIKFEYLIRSGALEYSTRGCLDEILNALLDEWLITCGYVLTGYSGNGTRCDTVHPAVAIEDCLEITGWGM